MNQQEDKKLVSPAGIEYGFSGAENLQTATKLKEGITCKVTGVGNSMTPKLKSRQAVTAVPVTSDTAVEKDDIVLCKARGHFYLHLVWALRKDGDTEMFLIGNNHGHANGWIPKSQVFGKVVEIWPM